MDPDGGNEEILTGDGSDAFDREPDWSPDGTMLVFLKQSQVGGCCEPWEIWAVNRDGSGDTNLTNHPADDTAPSWSPDGTTITFASNRNSESDIYTMPAPTAIPPGDAASATTSRDGAARRFAAGGGALRAVVAPATAESGVQRLTRGGSSAEPDWGKKRRNADSQNTPPTITELRPARDSTTTDRTPRIGATVTDEQTDLAKGDLRLFLDGTKIPGTEFSYDQATDRLRHTPAADLAAGRHTVKVVARDPQGLVARKVWSFRVRS